MAGTAHITHHTGPPSHSFHSFLPRLSHSLPLLMAPPRFTGTSFCAGCLASYSLLGRHYLARTAHQVHCLALFLRFALSQVACSLLVLIGVVILNIYQNMIMKKAAGEHCYEIHATVRTLMMVVSFVDGVSAVVETTYYARSNGARKAAHAPPLARSRTRRRTNTCCLSSLWLPILVGGRAEAVVTHTALHRATHYTPSYCHFTAHYDDGDWHGDQAWRLQLT